MASLAETHSKTAPGQVLAFKFSSVSSASKDRYPSNTATQFTHHWPKEFFLNQKKRYCISLLSMSFSSKRIPQWSHPAYIRVHLNQLQYNMYAAPDRTRCLAQLVLPDRRRDARSNLALDWYYMNNPISLPLDPTLDSIRHLSFTITDEKNQPLQLPEDSPPTIINCLIQEMETVNQFTLTLNPTVSRDLFPTNTDQEFMVSFGIPVTTDTSWQVALHSVIVPSGVKLLGDSFDITFTRRTLPSIKMSYPNRGQTALDMLKHLRQKAEDMGIYMARSDSEHYTVSFEEEDESKKIGTSMHFNPSLCKLFNMVNVDLTAGMVFKPEQTIEQRTFPHNSKIIFDKKIKLMEQMAIYADFVQHSVVGDSRLPLIDILSSSKLGLLGNTNAVDTLYTVPNLTFRPVSRTQIKTVCLKIAGIHGEEIEFEYKSKDLKVQYIFVFRK